MALELLIDHEDLRPGSYYWARRCNEEDAEIVQVSNVFGSDREYWTVAVMGSDQHRSLKEFVFLIRLMKP